MTNRASKVNYLIFAMAICASMATTSKADVFVLVNGLPQADAAIGKAVVAACRADGLTAHSLDPSDLNKDVLRRIRDDSLLILTDCGILPIESAPALDEYISGGGRLISLGGTLFSKPLTMDGGKWLTQEEYLGKHARSFCNSALMDYSKKNLKHWTRRTTTADRQVFSEIVKDSRKGLCLHMSIESIGDYELLFSTIVPEENLQKQKKDFVVFWAKGSSSTLRMSIIFEELDGSSWVSEIPLTSKWKQYAISVKDFTQRSPARFQDAALGKEDEFLDTSKIKRFACGQIRRPDCSDFANHEFWIGKIGFSKANEYEPKIWDIEFKSKELLYPGYLVYPCSDVGKITASRNQKPLIGEKRFYVPGRIQAFHPRTKSIGWGKERNHRWIPLLEAISPTGQYRGTIAALRFDRNLEHMWAGVAIEDAGFYLHKNTTGFVVDLAKRMLAGNFIWEGGSTQFTYFPEQDIGVGASAIVKNTQPDLHLDLAVAGQKGLPGIPAKSTGELPLELDSLLGKADSFQGNGPYSIRVSLVSKEGVLVDQIEHDFEIWQPSKDLGWITAQNGEFYLDGELWHPFGVNYMPSSGIARAPEDGYAFNHWFSSGAYDPDVIERDLAHIAGLGMNTVGVFLYNNTDSSWNFTDFLRRCENHDLRVDFSFRDVMTRLDFKASKVKELIEKNRLNINRTVFFYDLAWEYRFQSGYYDFPDTTKDWNEWLVNKYATLEGAIDAWGFKPEIAANGLAVPPTHQQWYQSGDWNKMLGDYSVFLNTILDNRFSIARDFIRSIDPHHLVGFRMQYSGDPTFVYPPLVPYDLKGLANAVDVMRPEAYGRVGPWERVRGGMFTTAYARAVAPELPVVWPEIGYSVWNPIDMTSPLKLHNEGAGYYRDFLNMLLESHANGVVFWWYPGGFRTMEESDYGIINPDGTDRPITTVIREFAPKFKKMGPIPTPEAWVAYPREWKPGGIVGAYEQIKDEFWHNVDAGKATGLKVEE